MFELSKSNEHFFISTEIVFSDSPTIGGSELSVKVGHVFHIYVDNVHQSTEVIWNWYPILNCNKQDNLTITCAVYDLRGNDSVDRT